MTDSELVERLRQIKRPDYEGGGFRCCSWTQDTCEHVDEVLIAVPDVADRLEQLAGEVAEAREALKDMLAAIKYADGCIDHLDCLEDYGESWHKAMERAKALGEKEAAAMTRHKEPVIDNALLDKIIGDIESGCEGTAGRQQRMSLRWMIYRATMRLAHRFHWHYAPPIYPERDTVLWCQWCGLRYKVPPHTSPLRLEGSSEWDAQIARNELSRRGRKSVFPWEKEPETGSMEPE